MLIDHLVDLNIALVEQPSCGADAFLSNLDDADLRDWIWHASADLPAVGKYDCVNIKLDKSADDRRHDLKAKAHNWVDIMVGCMVGTSLAMALATACLRCGPVDLDGPLLCERSRHPDFI